VTGAAVTKTLLEQHDTARVTVFEARELCSGATGRNGGQLAINAAENYVRVRRDVGAEMAGKMIHFSLATLREMRAIARDFGQPDPELHEVNKVRIFRDDALLKRAVEGVAALEADHPELRGIYRVLDADECRQASLGQVSRICHNTTDLI
jgi:glycine/D-amino acid oxidase-like deaminating enzyme